MDFNFNYRVSSESEQSNLFVSSSAIEKAKEIILNTGYQFDVYALGQEFLDYARRSKFEQDNVDEAFIGFVMAEGGYAHKINMVYYS